MKKEKIFTGVFIVIMLASSLVSLGNYFFYSTLPLYAQQIGSPAAMIGFITGTYTLACLITRVFAGSLCDKYGRFILMVIGSILCITGCLGYFASANIFMLLAARAIHGIGFALFTTGSGTAVVDVLPKSRRMEGLGYFSLYSTISSAIGPGIALSMIENRKLGFGFLFLFAAGIMAATLLLTISIRKTVLAAYTLPFSGRKTDKWFLKTEPQMFAPAIIMVLLCFSQSSIISYLAVYAGEQKLGNIGLFFTISSIAIFAARFWAGRIGDRFGISFVLIPCILLAAGSLFLIALAPGRVVLFLYAIPYGLGFGAAGPVINTLIVNSCDDSLKSTATSMYYASLDIGIGLGSIILGALSAFMPCRNVILLSGVVALSAIIVYLRFGAIRESRTNG